MNIDAKESSLIESEGIDFVILLNYTCDEVIILPMISKYILKGMVQIPMVTCEKLM